ncbi:sialate O-acetylesterase [Rhodococcus sp. 06-156-3C]|uniref:sialate O-acetylesterase n=1 Tax=Nocardiaceae TaxID=85025 RepID=UPI000522E476|nr:MULTISPECIES: sialate O-acetylesterase [Rhodococcus]OZD17718.1 sialate O-acetylesterase [Rhodococcus sp. 06-156-4C]OZD20247.1 sialate O-acetylesterase [Rhodococcus sp. 06-156-3C]OZD21482.1 sialate O-acetylesterase [Rhodococcus sp. 06-156-4a]OZD33315.1 sialate O-acetylesterase [Rhodococcus sp. 06-156-3b]OZD40088.1 sialate O-acetylesterase [Rhodococcus sp. 06-156-3]
MGRLKNLEVRAKDVIKRRLGTGLPVTVFDEPYLLVAVLGQSNAHGAGMGLDMSGLDAPHPRVHQWAASGKSKNTIVAGCDPLFHEVPSKAVGFAPVFARELADSTGRPVLLVPYARGDSAFARVNGVTWDPADRAARLNLFWNGMERIRSALALHPANELAAVLWHQGESDVPLTPGPVYAQKLDSVIDTIREEFGDIPFVIGQMVPDEIASGHQDYPVIDAVHRDTPDRRPRVVFVPGPEGLYNTETEKIHYNAAGQRDLGSRMWTAFSSI